MEDIDALIERETKNYTDSKKLAGDLKNELLGKFQNYFYEVSAGAEPLFEGGGRATKLEYVAAVTEGLGEKRRVAEQAGSEFIGHPPKLSNLMYQSEADALEMFWHLGLY